ncbi:MAG: hypothetical protein M1839_002432 [Geoglossum umbratile]|nr:MAG: hypothetical protein M1839_002432 [Geoglossum umbratile]
MRSLTAVWLSPARAAVAALVVLQIGFGVGYRISRGDRKYIPTFSTSASASITEFLKFLVSAILFIREWFSRTDPNFQYYGYLSLEDSDDGGMPPVKERLFLRFPRVVMKEAVGRGKAFGFVQLALLYAVVNNEGFMLFRIADPATVQLLNSGVAMATAIAVVVGLGTGFGELQWVAIVTQLCGLTVSQLGPEQGSAYPATVFLFVMIYGYVSALTGVYHQSLNQSSGASLHLDNMVLFLAGSCINLAIHFILSWWIPGRPGFFDGYNDPVAVVLVLGSVFTGLAATAIYKYAGAVTKCFATSVSTGIILFVSILLFNAKTGVCAVFGTIVVFLAACIYLVAPDEQDLGLVPAATKAPFPLPSSRNVELWDKGESGARESLPSGRFSLGSTVWIGWVSLAIKGAATVAIVAATIRYSTPSPPVDTPNAEILPPTQLGVLNSPLSNTLAFIRWDSGHPERGRITEAYRPFFYDMHYSIPNNVSDTNLRVDGFEDELYVYKQVADTMQLILDERPKINGLLYYRFDSWIDPLRFDNMNFNNIWFPNSVQPKFVCMKHVEALPWMSEAKDDARRAKVAATILKKRNSGYEVDIDQFCNGSADIYYIPRHLFKDFIYLSSVFYDLKIFHQIAIPTMVTMIDNTYRALAADTTTQISPLDCWSNSSSSGPSRYDVTWKKCGSKLDYLDRDVTLAFYDRLGRSARWLGAKGPKFSGIGDEKCEWATNPWWSGWVCPDMLSKGPSGDQLPSLGADFTPKLLSQKPPVSF